MKKEDLKIVFLGTPDFSVESLDALVNGGYNIKAVVTMPDKPAGRGHKLLQSPVKQYAESKGLYVLQPKNLKDSEFIASLKEINADLFIVIAFRMLPREVWSMPPMGTFNLHASLLPRYRGAAPINRAIMNGDSRSGVTTFFLRHDIDTGDIIRQKEVEILPTDCAGDLHDKLMHVGAEMVIETVEDILAGTLTTEPQPEGEFIPAPKIFRQDCEINWNSDCISIHNHVRGLSPYPAARSSMIDDRNKTTEIKIFETRLTEISVPDNTIAGTVKIDGHKMLVATANKYIEILSLQPAGKRRIDTAAFLLGYKPKQFIRTEDI